MPQYQYIDDRTGKVYDLIQGMNEAHEAFAPDGHKLTRLFSSPNTAIDSNINPFSTQDFLKKTGTKDTVGALWDRSKELSEKRINKEGYDPVKQKAIENYSKRRRGKKPLPWMFK